MGCCAGRVAADADSELAQHDAIQAAGVEIATAPRVGSTVANPLNPTAPVFASMAPPSSNRSGGSVTGLWPSAPCAAAGDAAFLASPPKTKTIAAVPRMSISLPRAARTASAMPSPRKKRCNAGHALQPHTCTNAHQDDMCDEFCAISVGDRMYRCDQCAVTLCGPCYAAWAV